jgi:glycerol-3-phosphate acyltransferase PlsY
VGSLLAVLSFPLWLRLFHARLPSYVLTALLLVLIVVRHRDNIARLLSHKEQRM